MRERGWRGRERVRNRSGGREEVTKRERERERETDRVSDQLFTLVYGSTRFSWFKSDNSSTRL